MPHQHYYFLIAMALASLTLSVIFFLAWKSLGQKPYALTWSIGFMVAACQWFLSINSAWFPSHEIYWLTVSALGLVLMTLVVRGHCQRTDCQFLPANFWPYTGLIYGVIVWATVISPHVGIRTALLPASAAVALFLSALIIFRHRERPRSAELAAALSILMFGISRGIAAVIAAMQGVAGDSVHQELLAHYNFLTLPAGYMAMGMFVIFMLASDISEDMREIAIRDQLTGVFNRRGMGERGAAAYATACRNNLPLSVIMTDIDRFKFINDEYGHAFGDMALVHFADLLADSRRVEDVLARVGGEEFAIILPGTKLQDALSIADKLCVKVESSPMQHNDVTLNMTASFGVATLSERDTYLSDMIARADQALYRCKRAGRNRVDLESSQLMRATDGTLKPITA